MTDGSPIRRSGRNATRGLQRDDELVLSCPATFGGTDHNYIAFIPVSGQGVVVV